MIRAKNSGLQEQSNSGLPKGGGATIPHTKKTGLKGGKKKPKDVKKAIDESGSGKAIDKVDVSEEVKSEE
jgi:hypothetical protein